MVPECRGGSCVRASPFEPRDCLSSWTLPWSFPFSARSTAAFGTRCWAGASRPVPAFRPAARWPPSWGSRGTPLPWHTTSWSLRAISRAGPGRGMQVAATLPSRRAPKPVRSAAASGTGPPRVSTRGQAIAAVPIPGLAWSGTPPRPFRPGVPALDLFPLRLWSRLVHRRLRRPPPLGYGDPAGYAPLRAAIADYVSAARGARCVADQVIVVNGSQQGVDLAARVLLDPGDEAWMEDPGYPGARAALLAAGATLAPVPVDEEGIDVDDGMRPAPRARLAYVDARRTSSRSASRMSASRRLELLGWAPDRARGSSRTTTTASSATAAVRSPRCRGWTRTGGWSTSARSARRSCRRCGWGI